MNKKNICILTFPISKAGITPLSNLVEILSSLSNSLYLITGNEGYIFFKNYNKIHVYGINHQPGQNSIETVGRYILTQVKMSHTILKLWNKVDLYVLSIGAEGLLLPILTIKFLKKKIILIPADYTIKFKRDKLSQILLYLSSIARMISDKIILYSPNLISEWDMNKYQSKIFISPRHFINLNIFKIVKNYSQRPNLIGYIGRFSEEKGVLNFVKSIPLILNKNSNLKFLLIGDGQQRKNIEDFIHLQKLESNLQIMEWINHDDLPYYLNDLKLLVLPSYTEGLPNIMLEAMACGTPVLATKVGAIPDIVTDTKTGFFMENNSPKCIAENVLKVLDSPNIEQVLKNARELVEVKFTYESVIEKYSYILENLN